MKAKISKAVLDELSGILRSLDGTDLVQARAEALARFEECLIKHRVPQADAARLAEQMVASLKSMRPK